MLNTKWVQRGQCSFQRVSNKGRLFNYNAYSPISNKFAILLQNAYLSSIILSAIAAVKAEKGSKCRHGRHGTSNVVPVVPADYIATSEAASGVVYSVTTASVEPIETSQKQEVTEIISTAPTKAVQVSKPNKYAEEVMLQEPATSSQKAALSSIRQPEENTKSSAAGVAHKGPIKKFCGSPN
ncbi:hypothetical protein NW765_009309 [Fusarium oxysporum]|nr:hypothetical protein NW765_009309 [Fusarium oxysporum]